VATFNREQLVSALNDLVDELAAAHVSARIRIVGGAAIVLAHDPERGSTRDVDALSSPDPDHPEPAWEVMIDRNGVVVEVGTARSPRAPALRDALTAL
jgi:hypothetical protein